MCINCNLTTPITDGFADYLGVDRRKYLIVGSDTAVLQHDFNNYMETEKKLVPKFESIGKWGWFCIAYSNQLYNNKTIDFFHVSKMPSITVIKNGIPIKLYEGRIKVLGPLPKSEQLDGWDKYLELFEGDIIWEDNPPIPISPEKNPLSFMANSYRPMLKSAKV